MKMRKLNIKILTFYVLFDQLVSLFHFHFCSLKLYVTLSRLIASPVDSSIVPLNIFRSIISMISINATNSIKFTKCLYL